MGGGGLREDQRNRQVYGIEWDVLFRRESLKNEEEVKE